MWDLLKRAFGRSRTIFLNVVSVVLMIFVELSDSLLNFDWDALFKHEVAVGIGLVMQVVNVIIRLDTSGSVNFGRIEDHDIPVLNVPDVLPVENTIDAGEEKKEEK